MNLRLPPSSELSCITAWAVVAEPEKKSRIVEFSHFLGRLMRYFISSDGFAKSKGIERITLLTDDDNFKAHKFYEKNGFEKSSMVVFRTFLNE